MKTNTFGIWHSVHFHYSLQLWTKVVLKQAWDEGIKPVLVLNKIDRLVIEMKLDTETAYMRLREDLKKNCKINDIVHFSVRPPYPKDIVT